MKKMFLIDGMSVVFRAYHAMSGSNLKSPSGEPTGALFGFSNILTSLLEKENPEYISVVFDTSEPTFRHEFYPEYKANREAFPEDLVPQMPRIKTLLDLIGIPRHELPGYEADDIIGTLSKIASEEGFEVICLTSDKDYYQLVNDNVRLYKPAGKGGEFDVVGPVGVVEKFGCRPDQVIDVLALTGDKVDNVPGVKGVGEKTAIPLIEKFGSVEGIYEHIDEVSPEGLRNKLIADRDKAFLSKKLVTIALDVPVDFQPDDCLRNEPNFRELDDFFAKSGFNTIRLKWRQKSGDLFSTGEEKGETSTKTDEAVEDAQPFKNKLLTLKDVEHEYILVDDFQKLEDALAELNNSDILSFDLETSSLDRQACEIVGIALCGREGKAFYIPVDDRLDGITPQGAGDLSQESLFSEEGRLNENNAEPFKSCLPTKSVIEKLTPLLTNSTIGKCGQNCKFDTFILSRYGIQVSPVVFDSMIASYILDPDQQHNLDALSSKWLNYEPVPITSLIGEKKSTQISMKEVDPALICDYAAEDADLALKLRNKLHPVLVREKLTDLAEKIEFPLIEVLTRMERNGVAINTASLRDISIMIDRESVRLTQDIYKEAGIEFNIDSPKQLGHILFEKMMIPPVKQGKTGYSTDVQVLSQLAALYPIADMILQYRQLVKIKSTYVDTLPKLINPLSGRIHTTYNQTIASTGRLSSTDPNLQNIPIRTDLGKEIRKAFVPQNGNAVILSADYSQIELRIMAHICGDRQLVDAFRNGLDIHAATASILFEKPIEEVDADMRRVAKTVNFGIMYGLGSFGLSQRLGLSRNVSKEIIDNYFIKYPGIRKYIDLTIEEARKKGYAETLCGRRRYFNDINSKNRNLRTAAERAAINMPIQGTASDMMKIAMINIDREMRRLGFKSMMMLQVHDEFVFEAFTDELDELRKLVTPLMETALPLGDVPVVVETGTGENWFEAH